MNEIYETKRLNLKILDSSYAPHVLEYYIRNKDFLNEWEPVKEDDFYTIEAQAKQLEDGFKNIQSNRMLRLWIFKKDDNKLIGAAALNNIVYGAFLSCYLGYKLDKDEINKGYMTEAVNRIIDIAFNEYKLHRIEANIMPKNKASLSVVEKLGFRNEGLAYKYLRINGKWEDHIHMVLLNDRL